MINKISAIVVFNTVYACSQCGKTGIGGQVTIKFDGFSTDNLKRCLDRQPQRAHDMPINWANYPTGFICSACNTKRKVNREKRKGQISCMQQM